ncbi:ParA family protein [Robiginitomaculum antarcticum]|uniref:ParA family protein n=1 Tax=Robiginitomaculum antarcticum TaxID=437507 RepID=UPI00036E07E6|nr:ParA family protein [Robiginitomaculum antarcticum]
MKTIAIVNQKGGVGKTTTTINLAAALTLLGKTVLIIDLDPQGNASTGLGLLRADRNQTSYDLLVDGVDIDDTIHETSVPNLQIIPSDMDLSGAELEIGEQAGRTTRLKSALNSLSPKPDYILIDCPPSLSLLTVNALAASDSVLVPLQCEFYALEGLSQLLKTVEMAKANINPALIIEGVMLTMYDQRNRLSAQVAADVRKHLGRAVFKTMVPRNVRIAEAPSYGRPVLMYDRNCAGSIAYMDLAKEILARRKPEQKRGT